MPVLLNATASAETSLVLRREITFSKTVGSSQRPGTKRAVGAMVETSEVSGVN